MAANYYNIRAEAIKRAHLKGTNPNSWSPGDKRDVADRIQEVSDEMEYGGGDLGLSGVDPRVKSIYDKISDPIERENALANLAASDDAEQAMKDMWSDFAGGSGPTMNTLGPGEEESDSQQDDRDQRTKQEEPKQDTEGDESGDSDEGTDEQGDETPEESEADPSIGEDTDAKAAKPDLPDFEQAEDGAPERATAGKNGILTPKEAAGKGAGSETMGNIGKLAKGTEGLGETAEALEEIGAVSEAWPLVIIIAAVVIFFVLGLLFWAAGMKDAGANECSGGTSTTVTELALGSPNSGGYYQLPENPNYTLKSSRDQQWGGKTLIQVINIVATGWNTAHPDSKLAIGDLNAPGHASHTQGIDVDIYAGTALMQLPDHSTNPNYDPKLAIELGKMFFDTGVIDYIFYNDKAVNDAITAYKSSKGLPGKIEPWPKNDYNSPDHKNHFHVRVTNGAKPNGTLSGSTSSSTSCSSSSAGGVDTAGDASRPANTASLGSGWTLKDNVDYSQTACAAGSTDEGNYKHPVRGFTIRKCKTVVGIVASIISARTESMIAAAKAAGVSISGDAWRSYEEQQRTYAHNCSGGSCNPPTAHPGNSQHERGLAIDFNMNNKLFAWLKKNGAKYGYINFSKEEWHWSMSGN